MKKSRNFVKNVRTLDQEEFGRPNLKKKNVKQRSNARAYSSKSARVELERSDALAYSSKSARLESCFFT